MDILIFILILSFLVIIHELGHFLLAKKFKVKVKEFGLGYPPKICQLFKYQETAFTLNAIPIGGFVNLSGENAEEKELKKTEQFYHKKPQERLIIILGGIIVNFIFGIIIFCFIPMLQGIPENLSGVFIGSVMDKSPASQAITSSVFLNNQNIKLSSELTNQYQGMQAESKLLKIKSADDSQEIIIDSIDQAKEIVANNRGKKIFITTQICPNFQCQDIILEQETYIRTEMETPPGEGALGIRFQETYLKKYPFYQMPFRGLYFGIKESFNFAYMIIQALSKVFGDLIFKQEIPKEVAGPIGIIYEIKKVGLFDEGFLSILFFSGVLSLNLAVMNLLPIPALDGGRAFFIFLELIFGRKKIEKIEFYANYFGLFFLLGLTILVTFNDIKKVFKGN